MFVDLRALPSSVELRADLCIIGAGAAGITLAREFIGTDVQVCVIESGGLVLDAATQSLDQIESVGADYYPCRLRAFGGTTVHWHGRCWPLEALDFSQRSWVPHSGWPFSRADLDPYYQRAQHVCAIGSHEYQQLERYRSQTELFLTHKLITRFSQRSQPVIRFGDAYRTELESAPNVRVLLHANATEIKVNEAASAVTHVELRTLGGRRGLARAAAFVLACGGIENARLLLLSNSVVSAGLGNSHDLVGRFLMDHPHRECGFVLSGDPDALLALFGRYGHRPVQGQNDAFVEPGISLSPGLQEKEEALNASANLVGLTRIPDGVAAARAILDGYRAGDLPDDMAGHLWRVITDLDDALPAIARFAAGRPQRYGVDVAIEVFSEQAPNPSSRITLTEDRDPLGLRKAAVDWRTTDLDRRTQEVTTRAIATELGRLGLGRVKIDLALEQLDLWQSAVRVGPHPSGTTRMSRDPRHGVVDASGRVHGIENLYVVGSSVFPTIGYANPTFTIVALALRLADRLKKRLSSSRRAPNPANHDGNNVTRRLTGEPI